MRLLRHRKLLAATATIAALSIGGLAVAAWLSDGTGNVYGGAKTAQSLSTVDVAAGTTADLYPGATGAALIKISNPNPYPVRITTVSKGAGAIKADAAHEAGGCVTTGVSFDDQTGLTIDVPANGSAQAPIPGAIKMSNASDDGCQGATFTIPVTFTGSSSAA